MTTGMVIGATAATYFVFSAAADAMSPPTAEQARAFYGFLYRFIQRLAANANRYVSAKYPGLAEGLRADDLNK